MTSPLPNALSQALNEYLKQVTTDLEKEELRYEAQEAWETTREMQEQHVVLDSTPEEYALRLFEAGLKLRQFNTAPLNKDNP